MRPFVKWLFVTKAIFVNAICENHTVAPQPLMKNDRPKTVRNKKQKMKKRTHLKRHYGCPVSTGFAGSDDHSNQPPSYTDTRGQPISHA